MNYTTRLNQVIATNGAEVYPGQNQELIMMTMSPGCDICEHVPTLVEYGRMVNHITEMGVRFGWSTRSFLYAQPQTLRSIDKYEWNSVHQSGAVQSPGNSCFKEYRKKYPMVDHTYTLADTMTLDPIEPTELLFIDTFHHRDCLKVELARHGNQASRFIILHDTTTFGERGQADDSRCFVDFVATDEPGTGLWAAIDDFLALNPQWTVRENFTNNNGLTVLERG
jgi:hypothetical protein